MTTAYYSSRRAAIAGARRVLEKEGVTAPLVQVHFSIVEQVEGESWTWERIDNTPAIKAEKPATPQVDALPGMTPLGVRETTVDTHARRQAQVRAGGARSRAEGVAARKAARKAARQAEAAKAAVDAAPPVPTPAVRPSAERWRKAKRVEPGRVAYRPRAGSKQDKMYGMLTADAGVTPEAFCHVMNTLEGGSDKWTASSIWSSLNYLFVTLKGYGLEFDGQVFRLLRPADERAHEISKKG